MTNSGERERMELFLLIAPLCLVFEVWQLVISERYLGIKQIARNGDPRALGLGETTAFLWIAAIACYWIWMATLLFTRFTRVHGLCLIAVWLLGFSLRRNTSLKWTLVILTFEGAVRIGLLVSLFFMASRRMWA
jgi:hypothetical protein